MTCEENELINQLGNNAGEANGLQRLNQVWESARVIFFFKFLAIRKKLFIFASLLNKRTTHCLVV
ncbi:hypothetical protein DMA11_08405 [Marinilabiliaceae bacterium JC017]|nr:hypothetical protein DMA11_08405 [Marinilabiliaceae bacterium JC017]